MKITETFCSPEKAVEFATPSGDRYHEQYIGVLDKETGNIKLKSVGKVDVYAEIQSYDGETDINNLIQRAEAGDLSAFTSAVFGDFTDVPKSYAEALNIVIEAEREFNHLPQEVKDKFDNNYQKYIAIAGSEEWLRNFGVELKKEKDEKEEVTDNGSEQ